MTSDSADNPTDIPDSQLFDARTASPADVAARLREIERGNAHRDGMARDKLALANVAKKFAARMMLSS